jgi:hypothetical protein
MAGISADIRRENAEAPFLAARSGFAVTTGSEKKGEDLRWHGQANQNSVVVLRLT